MASMYGARKRWCDGWIMGRGGKLAVAGCLQSWLVSHVHFVVWLPLTVAPGRQGMHLISCRPAPIQPLEMNEQACRNRKRCRPLRCSTG